MALTPTEREEHFFKAMVDAADGSTPEELEPTERKEHWYNEIIDAIKAGGGSGGERFIVTLTPTSPDFSGTMDKTVAEINAAYEAGQQVVFRVYTSATSYHDVNISEVFTNSSYQYPSYNGVVLDNINNVLIFAYTLTTDDGTKQTYGTTIYTLTPAT